MWTISSVRDVISAFALRNLHVISFAGFGELGYENPTTISSVAWEVLAALDPSKISVNTGTLLRQGGQNGIADIYPFAAQLGIETTGIHPSVALDFSETHQVSPFCEKAWFVADDTWGGFDVDGNISPTLQTTLAITDELVVVGGGKYAANELEAFIRFGKPVRYFPARMNPSTSKAWCRASGTVINDSRGAAYHTWSRLKGSIHGRPRSGLRYPR